MQTLEFQSLYLTLSARRTKLLTLWQDANANLAVAYDRAEQVLAEIGFQPVLDS